MTTLNSLLQCVVAKVSFNTRLRSQVHSTFLCQRSQKRDSFLQPKHDSPYIADLGELPCHALKLRGSSTTIVVILKLLPFVYP